jgi:cell fate (sporulation/competence/biofilm development) regulator YlbF (YheA/YmcA/DUF963 family)
MTSSNPYDMAHELARSITSSEIYSNYVVAKKALDENSELKGKVLKLREMQMEMNKAEILGEDLPAEKIREITLEFARLNQEKVVQQFFTTEGAFVQMFTDIQEIIQKAIEQGFEY